LLLPDGTTHVVENVGFRRFQPRVVRSSLRLSRAHRRLEAALEGQDPTALREAAQESLAAMEDALLIAGQPVQETPTVW
jgi:DNA-binding FadR family transcriptional regulator